MDIRLDLTGQLTESPLTFVMSSQVRNFNFDPRFVDFWSSGIDRRQFGGRSNRDLIILDGFDPKIITIDLGSGL